MAEAIRLTPPDNFNFEETAEWPQWKARWTQFYTASKLKKETGETQVATLLYVMGVQATQIYDTFTFQAAGDKDKHDVVLAKFDQHFIPKVNTIHERAIFHSRLQQQGETIETYVRALHKIAKNCDFRNHHDDAIRDQLVIGIQDKGLSERLQLTQDLDLAKAIDKCRTSELVKKADVKADNYSQPGCSSQTTT